MFVEQNLILSRKYFSNFQSLLHCLGMILEDDVSWYIEDFEEISSSKNPLDVNMSLIFQSLNVVQGYGSFQNPYFQY